MTKTGQTIVIYQGEDKTVPVNLYDGSGNAYGSTSGLTFVWKVAASETATSALLTKSTGNGITNGTSQIAIALDEADTDDWTAGNYYHECRVTDSSGDETVVFAGTFTVNNSITKTA